MRPQTTGPPGKRCEPILDVRPERWPAGKAVLAGDGVLRIGQLHRGILPLQVLQQILGLLLQMFEIRAWR
jgi:hypothetical protein